jgi:hypothetical protein
MTKKDYNSMNPEPEQILVYLSLGYRTPQNDYERKLLKGIKAIHAKGQCVEIPGNGLY